MKGRTLKYLGSLYRNISEGDLVVLALNWYNIVDHSEVDWLVKHLGVKKKHDRKSELQCLVQPKV
tara:strand:- start:423 stop:617 length:195 start_codon:yes stop_codon:yes gene_type:complete